MNYCDKHPFKPFVCDRIEKLIIGTIPPHRFCKPCSNQEREQCSTDEDEAIYNQKRPNLNQRDIDFYYGSSDSYFWRIIEDACEIRFDCGFNKKEQVDACVNWAKNCKVGFVDVIDACVRTGHGSGDDGIKNICDNCVAIKKLFSTHNTIKCIVYTSTTAERLFRKCFPKKAGGSDSVIPRTQNIGIETKSFKIENLCVKAVRLPSPSPRNINGNNYDGTVEIYKKFLCCSDS